MYFIFMLTHGDKTIANCLEVLDQVLPLGLRHIGFKDVGVSPETLDALNRRIQAAGAASYMEVVSETPQAVLQSAQVAARLGVDRLLGGTDIAAVREIIDGAAIAYFPFPGFPAEHPTKLKGSPQDVAAHCRRFMSQGAAGVDLLAYRATEADPLDLVHAARGAVGDGELIVAGSIDSPAQIGALAEAGADGFTIGTAIFDGSFARDRDGLAEQIRAVLDCLP